MFVVSIHYQPLVWITISIIYAMGYVNINVSIIKGTHFQWLLFFSME